MDRFKRPAVWVPLAICALLMAAGAGAGITYFLLQGSGYGSGGFTARGTVLARGIGQNAFSPDARDCKMTVRSGQVVQPGTPVIVSFDGEVVGTGQLPVGRYVPMSSRVANCQFDFTVEVSSPNADGAFEIEVLGRTSNWSRDELSSGRVEITP